MIKKGLLFFLTFFLAIVPFSSVRAEEDPLLKIQAFPDQNSVKPGMMFLVRVEARNTSSDTTTEFWSNSCSYEKHWVTDASGVLIQSWTCPENSLEQVTLDPGSSYEKNIILYIPQKDKTEPVTFRLGFKRMSEDGDVAEPLWSDPVTINVIVPDDMKEAPADTDTPAPDAEANEATDENVTGKTEAVPEENAPQPAVPESPVMLRDRSLMFRDPGVPIKVAPGDFFTINLEGDSNTPHFRWKMTLPENDPTVTFLDSSAVASMQGIPVGEGFRFRAVTKGETKAVFVYENPLEPLTAPARKIFTVIVQEN